MSNFNESEEYKKALSEYQHRIYFDALHPINSIVVNEDSVYLFYEQKKVFEILDVLDKEYKKQNDEDGSTDFPAHLGCEEPKIEIVTFMGVAYRSIALWYDHGEVPEEFLPNLKS